MKAEGQTEAASRAPEGEYPDWEKTDDDDDDDDEDEDICVC